MCESEEVPTPGRGSYTFPVAIQMETLLGGYEQDRAKYHEELAAAIGDEDREGWELIQQTSKALIRGVGDLASFSHVSEGKELLGRVLAVMGGGQRPTEDGTVKVMELLSEDVSIDLGWDVMSLMHKALDRFWAILPLTAPIEPSWRTAAFLKRVSKCYIYGFDPECIVMCRSVLDAEFEAEIANDVCIGILGSRDRTRRDGEPVFDLYDRIIVAEKTERIGHETVDKAHAVRKIGRNVVHRWPKTPKQFEDSLPVIADTMDVIRELAGEK